MKDKHNDGSLLKWECVKHPETQAASLNSFIRNCMPPRRRVLAPMRIDEQTILLHNFASNTLFVFFYFTTMVCGSGQRPFHSPHVDFTHWNISSMHHVMHLATRGKPAYLFLHTLSKLIKIRMFALFSFTGLWKCMQSSFSNHFVKAGNFYTKIFAIFWLYNAIEEIHFSGPHLLWEINSVQDIKELILIIACWLQSRKWDSLNVREYLSALLKMEKNDRLPNTTWKPCEWVSLCYRILSFLPLSGAWGFSFYSRLLRSIC